MKLTTNFSVVSYLVPFFQLHSTSLACKFIYYKKVHVRQEKLLNGFSGYFLKKTDAAGQVLFLFKQKTDAGIFFETRNYIFKSCACTVISSDIIQVRP